VQQVIGDPRGAVRSLVFAAATALVLACATEPSGSPPVRVLFIGNSYTYVNDLPGIFADLSAAGGHSASVDMLAYGGWTLAQHAQDGGTNAKLAQEAWTWVVLQEQSLIPALPSQREAMMYPAVRTLADAARTRHIEPVLLLTWAYRDGYDAAGIDAYATMQAQIITGYLSIADELHLRIAPAGAVWQAALATDPSLELWESDGSHPSLAGSYLVACVLYATLYLESPEGLPGPSSLSASTVRHVQQVANTIVLGDRARWRLPPFTDGVTPR
jgi:hypothetical protein